MILTWTDADGNSQVFDNTSLGDYRIVKFDGLGAPPGNIIQQRAVLQHGSHVVDLFLEPRPISIELMVRADTHSEYEVNRKYISDLFSPITILGYPNVGLLSFLMADAVTQYEIAAIPQSVNHDSNRESQTVVFSLIELLAPDPYFLGPDDIIEGLVEGVPEAVSNSGEAPVYPILKVIGPSTDPGFINDTTQRTIRWEGSVPSGSRLEIDCENKTVTMIIISSGAETDSFSGLAPPPNDDFWPLISGPNTVRFDSTSGPGTASIIWREKFRSIY
jgi:hypothetical protein